VHNLNEDEIDTWEFVPTVCTDEFGGVVTPRQVDSFNCGVFVCMYVKYMFLDLPMLFSNKDMLIFRRRITTELAEGRVYY